MVAEAEVEGGMEWMLLVGFPLGVMKMFWIDVVMIVQLWKYTEDHWIVYFKRVHFNENYSSSRKKNIGTKSELRQCDHQNK